MLGYIQMQDLPSRVAEDHADVERTKRRGDDHKHVDRGDAVHLIAQKGQPGWRAGGRLDQATVGRAAAGEERPPDV